MRLTIILSVLALSACTFVTENTYVYEVPAEPNEPTDTAEEYDTGVEHIPGAEGTCSGSSDQFTANIWEVDGTAIHFQASDEQLTQMNEDWLGGWGGDYYTYDVRDETVGETYSAPTCITDPTNGVEANFGQVQVKLIGQSTGMEWSETTIPSFSMDVGEFEDNQVLGADETRWQSLHSGMISYLPSEPIAYAILGALGEPVPRTSLAWVSSNVWGDGIRIPYNAVEKYKQDWCADHADQLGGGCINLWEGVGDFNTHMFSYLTDDCELSGVDCDETRLRELVYLLSSVPYGDSFEEDTSSYLDWPAIKRSMCGSWMLWIGDDPFHNLNNVVTVEQANGLFRLLYYSVDLSAGASGWYQNTSLTGWNTMASGCYYDSDCWQSTMDTCEGMIEDLAEIDPVSKVDDFCARLEEAGMVRPGDDEECLRIRDWYEARVEELPVELECYREQYDEWLNASGEIFDTGYEPSDSDVYDSVALDSYAYGAWDTDGEAWYDCSSLMSEYLYI